MLRIRPCCARVAASLVIIPITQHTVDIGVARLEGCLTDIYTWMSQNKLKLNADKTEVLVLGTPKSPVARSRKGLYFRSQVNPRARKFPLVSCFRPTLGAYRQGGCRLQKWCTSFLRGHVLDTPLYVKRPQNGQNNRYRGRKATLKQS